MTLIDKTEALAVLRKAQIASCTCQIKTPDPEWHSHNCRYRVLREAEAMIDHLPDAALPARGVGVPESVIHRAVLEWIKKDAGAAVKMSVTPDQANALTARVMAVLEPTTAQPHPDDAAVDRFAAAMKEKLAQARAKGRGGWDDPAQCSVEFLAALLIGHIGKRNAGNFEDIANLAMMLHQRGADPSILAALEPAPTDAAQATAGQRLIAAASEAAAIARGNAEPASVYVPDAAQVREAAIRECADALRKVIDYAEFAGADPDEVEDAAINSYADYLLTLIGEKPREQRE